MSDIKEVIGADGEAVPAVSELRLQPRVAVLKMNEGPDICILETGLIMVGDDEEDEDGNEDENDDGGWGCSRGGGGW